MKTTRTNALTKAPGISDYAIPLNAGIPYLFSIPVPDIFSNDPDDMLPAKTEEPGLSFSLCGRRLTRPCIKTRCIAGYPNNTGIVIPEVA